MQMKNFHSKSLGRDFRVLYITNSFSADKNKSASTEISAGTNEVGIGLHLPEAILDGLDGKIKTLSSFKGKPLIINVWASWCGPCRAEMGSLERLAQRYNGKEFNIIGISTDDYRDKASAAVSEAKITFSNFIDHNLELENMLGAKTIPLTILVASDGRVLEKIRGARNWDSPEMIDAIGKAFVTRLADKK
jgi:thiol-disulfide isomerase/thioredoxin